MPIIDRHSYSELPDWLRNYAQEAAIAARNLGVNVTPPAEGAPPGTMPNVRINPYQRYAGERFSPENRLEQSAQRMTMTPNPLIDSLREAEAISDRAKSRFHQSANQYMSPNINDILGAIESQSGRKFKETVLPALEAKYVRLGQHGSKKHLETAGRMARDIKTETAGLKLEALENAYEQAMKLYNQDQARLLETAGLEAERGNLRSFARSNDIGSLLQSGAYMRGLQERPLQAAEEDFRREQRHPYETINFLISSLNGVPSSSIMRGSANVPAAPTPPQSMRSADYAGLMAQLAPALIGQRSSFRRGP